MQDDGRSKTNIIDESKILYFPNGNLAVFDSMGLQIPKYQGNLKQILEEWDTQKTKLEVLSNTITNYESAMRLTIMALRGCPAVKEQQDFNFVLDNIIRGLEDTLNGEK